MSDDQSFINKDSVLMNITILVVDDDPIVLSIVSAILKSKDTSFMEISVITAKSSLEALSTLEEEGDNIDIVITDYHMPGMNGVELKKKIDEEFKKLPVVVMSSDTNNDIEQETLSSGAMLFMAKPIKPSDLNKLWQYALSSKMGKSAITDQIKKNNDENNDDNDDDGNNSNNVVVRRRQSSCFMEEVVSCGVSRGPVSKNHEERSDVNEDVVINGDNGDSKKGRKRRSSSDRKRCRDDRSEDKNDYGVSFRPPAPKKAKVVWTNSLHNLFLQAIRHIGLEKAVPKKILEFMNVPGLTRENIASHLQAEVKAGSNGRKLSPTTTKNLPPTSTASLNMIKAPKELRRANTTNICMASSYTTKYRIFLKKVAEIGMIQSAGILSRGRAMNSNFALGRRHIYSSSSPLGLGLGGQSRVLTTNNVSLGQCFNKPRRQYKRLTFATTQNPNPTRSVCSAYAGIRINDKGDFIGPLNVNANSFCMDSGCMNRNNMYIRGNSQGSNSTDDQETTDAGSSSSLLPALQTFNEFNRLCINGGQQELALVDDHGCSLSELPCNPSNSDQLNNRSQGVSIEVTMNPSAASELYSPAMDMNPKQVQQPFGDFMEIQSFDQQDWINDDFMDSLFDCGMC